MPAHLNSRGAIAPAKLYRQIDLSLWRFERRRRNDRSARGRIPFASFRLRALGAQSRPFQLASTRSQEMPIFANFSLQNAPHDPVPISSAWRAIDTERSGQILTLAKHDLRAPLWRTSFQRNKQVTNWGAATPPSARETQFKSNLKFRFKARRFKAQRSPRLRGARKWRVASASARNASARRAARADPTRGESLSRAHSSQ